MDKIVRKDWLEYMEQLYIHKFVKYTIGWEDREKRKLMYFFNYNTFLLINECTNLQWLQ